MIEQVELKPCPFCGGEAVKTYYTGKAHTMVECKRCRISTACINESEAVAAWNTRHERTCMFREVSSDECHGNTSRDHARQCSECGYVTLGVPRYCPDCGAKVVG